LFQFSKNGKRFCHVWLLTIFQNSATPIQFNMFPSKQQQNLQRSYHANPFTSQSSRRSSQYFSQKSSLEKQPTRIKNYEGIHRCIQQRQWESIRAYLRTGTGKDGIKQYANDSLLLLACKYGAPFDIVLDLVDLKPELLYVKDSETQQTLLHTICDNPSLKYSARIIARVVTQYPEAVTCVDSKGMTPLHYACKAPCKSSKIVSIIDSLCIIDPAALVVENKDGETPLEVFLMSQRCRTEKEENYQRRAMSILHNETAKYMVHLRDVKANADIAIHE